MADKRRLQNLALLVFVLLLLSFPFEYLCHHVLRLGNDYPNSSYWYRRKWLENHMDTSAAVTGYSIDRYDMLLGWMPKAALQNQRYEDFTVTTNQAGFRNTTNFDTAKNGKLRVLTIGDSFTFGECVANNETYPAQLEKLLHHAEVINAGVHGYGHDQQLLHLKREGIKYHPDIVILGYLNDDASRSAMWFRDFAKPYFKITADTLQLNNVPVPTPQQVVEEHGLWSISYLQAIYGKLLQEKKSKKQYSLTYAILKEIKSICNANGAKLVIIYLPWLDECKTGTAAPDKVLPEFCKQQGVLLVQPTQAIHDSLADEKDIEAHFACHYSAYINGLLARQLYQALKPQVAGN